MPSRVVGFTFNIVAENTYLIVDETGKTAIVDCGCMNDDECQVLERYIQDHALVPTHLLFTHLHFDHTWGMEWAMKRYGLQPMAHPEEREYTPSMAKQLEAMQIPSHSLGLDNVAWQDLHENEILQIGNTPVKVLFVPGHSAGHVAFYAPQDGYVLTGDALFREEIGRTDLWGGHYETLIRSIKTELMSLPQDTIVYSGHGPSSTVKHEQNNNPYLK